MKKLEFSDGIDSPFFTIKKREPGVIHIIVKDGGTLELKDIKESVALLDKITNGNEFLGLIDIRNAFMTISPSALAYIGSDNGQLKYCKAEAIVVDSLAVSLIMNFYIKFVPKNKISKTFKDVRSALAWLDSQKSLLATVSK